MRKKEEEEANKSTYARHYYILHVTHHLSPVLGLFGRLQRYRISQKAGLHIGRHSTIANRLQIVGYVVDHQFSMRFKLFRIHFAS